MGCGDLGCSDPDGRGEGAVAVMFPAPVSEFGFVSGGGNDGDIVVQSFRSDGTRIAEITVVADASFPDVNRFGFMRENEVQDIAGVSIHTPDPAGLLYDDFVFGEFSEKRIEITLDPAPTNGRYVIDATPAMPAVSATARVVNVTPDPTPTTMFTWTVNLTINKGTGEEVSFDEELEQGVVTLGEELFTLEFAEPGLFRGGNLKLTVEAKVDGEMLVGERDGLTIEGTNPDRSEIQDSIDDEAHPFQGLEEADIEDVLKRMACQESRQRQFEAVANGGIGPPLISPDNGVGIYQTTNTNRCPGTVLFEQCADLVFNWRENVVEGIRAYGDKVREARGHPGRLRGVQGYRDFIQDVV
jgi:hypothetical protein